MAALTADLADGGTRYAAGRSLFRGLVAEQLGRFRRTGIVIDWCRQH